MKKIAIFFLLLFIVGCKQIDVNDDILSGVGDCACGQIAESCNLISNLSTDSTCLNITTNNIEIDCAGYTILGTANNSVGININQVDNTTIKNCIIKSNLTDLKAELFEGIVGILGNSNATIYNNTLLNNSRAIRFENYISSVNITNNELHDGEVAIILWGGQAQDSYIIGNNISNYNTSYYYNSAITVRFINNLTIKENYIVNGDWPITTELYAIFNSTIENNVFIGGTQHQNLELIYGSANNYIVNNTIIYGTDGIFLTGSNNLIEQNNITEQVHHNIVIYTHPSVDNDITNNVIINNTLANAVYNGIITADMGPGDIYNNTISYNTIIEYGTTGIYFDFTGTTYGTSDNMSINNNFISSDLGMNLHNGFVGTSDYNLNFSNNVVNFSEQYAFYYVSPYEDRGLILENNIFKNAQVIVQYAYGSIINNNSILNSNEYGLMIMGGGDSIISNNYINNTQGDGFMNGIGLELSDTGNNNISNTIVDNSALYDIQGSMGQDNNLINCSFNTLDVIDAARIFVLEYVDFYVNDTIGSVIENANVTIYNNSNDIITNLLTDINGLSTYLLTNYVKDFSNITYYTNYKANAVKGFDYSETEIFNVSKSIQINLTLILNSCVSENFNFLCNSTINKSCYLDGNMSCAENGFIIGENNLIINGNGYTLNGTQGNSFIGINITDKNNITLTNLLMNRFNTGIYISNVTNSTIYNNTLNQIEDAGQTGIYRIYNEYSTNLNISSNNLYSINTAEDCLALRGVNDSIISNNYVESNQTASLSSIGIYLIDINNNNTIKNNNITGYDSSISIHSSTNNIFLNNILQNGLYGIVIDGTSDNNIGNSLTLLNHSSKAIYSAYNFVLADSTINSSLLDVYLGGDNYNLTLINTTFDNSKKQVDAGTLFVKWYLDVYVNDTNSNPVENAIVKIYSSIPVTSNYTGHNFSTKTFNYLNDTFVNVGGWIDWNEISSFEINGYDDAATYTQVNYFDNTEHSSATYKKIESNFTINSNLIDNFNSALLVLDYQVTQEEIPHTYFYSCWEQLYDGVWYLGIYKCNNIACTSFTTIALDSGNTFSPDVEYQMIFEINGSSLSCSIPSVSNITGTNTALTSGYDGIGLYYSNTTFNNTKIIYGENMYSYNYLLYNLTTNSTGNIERQNATEYFTNVTGTYYYTNYTINATKIGYKENSKQLNLTTNIFDFFITLFFNPNAEFINCSLNPKFIENSNILNNVTMRGNGTVNLFSNWTFINASQYILINKGCTFNIYDGEIN